MKGRGGCARSFGHEHDFCQAGKAENTDPRTNYAVKICYCLWPPKKHCKQVIFKDSPPNSGGESSAPNLGGVGSQGIRPSGQYFCNSIVIRMGSAW